MTAAGEGQQSRGEAQRCASPLAFVPADTLRKTAGATGQMAARVATVTTLCGSSRRKGTAMGMTMLQRIEHSKRLTQEARNRAQRRKAFQAEAERLAGMRRALREQGSDAASGDNLGFLIMVAQREGSSSSSHG